MAKSTKKDAEIAMDRRTTSERRKAGDRRQKSEPVTEERRGGERRQKVQRRRQIDPTTCERDYSTEEIEFMQAMDDYKRRSGRMFPTCSEILEVIRDMGYVRQNGPAPAPAVTAVLEPVGEYGEEDLDADEADSFEATAE